MTKQTRKNRQIKKGKVDKTTKRRQNKQGKVDKQTTLVVMSTYHCLCCLRLFVLSPGRVYA